MDKINYQEIVDYIKSIESLKNLKSLYRQDCKFETVYLEGITGLRTITDVLNKFYICHFFGIQRFDDIMNNIFSIIGQISSEDIENGVFSKLKYKAQILQICSLVERLDEETKSLFSVFSMLKFFNSTFQTDTLLYNINFMYPPHVWDFIPLNCKKDITEGARGLLVEIPTGSAFLFLRALEGCIRYLCNNIDGSQEEIMFGPGIDYLERFFNSLGLGKKEKEFVERQIDFLRYIKDEFRNPSAHPEKSFEKFEAEQLFQVVNVAINRLYELYILKEQNGLSASD